MRVHFIAIGGSAMHNLALALHYKGYQVTGSDDAVFEPSKGRLLKADLLPYEMGWFPEKIEKGIDAVILGMHAREDNSELKKALDLGLKVYSYPEFLYQQSKNKKRIVIGGSHGKTTITSMILHVLQYHKVDCDYMVGAQLEGFDTMVRLTEEAPMMLLEGDEYLSSPIDRRPKFHLYQPHIALLSGIAWDHINVFPTFENYVEQFSIFADMVSDALVYCQADDEILKLMQSHGPSNKLPYQVPAHEIKNGITFLNTAFGEIPLKIFGDHNLMNMEGARLVCEQVDINAEKFYEAIQTFKGASKRLEEIARTKDSVAYKDFAHSPSKVKATTHSVKQQFGDRKLVACLELHTFSSLNETFLKEYEGALDFADVALVYFSPKALAHKKMPDLDPEMVRKAFVNEKVEIFTDSEAVQNRLNSEDYAKATLLLMTSGNFDGVDLNAFATRLLSK
jgi:UDP-N-acetylmuramate: L-alanyl-gamma-D-glutamyl-meso-diaminopimelate ligase